MRRAATVLALALVAACGGGVSGGDDAATATTAPEGPEVVTDLEELTATAEDEAAAMEAILLEQAGIDPAGAATAFDEVAAALDAEIESGRAQIEAAPIQGFLPPRRAQFESVGSSSGIFVGASAAGLLGSLFVEVSNGGQATAGSSNAGTIDISRGRVVVETGARSDRGRVRGGAQVRVDLQPCPDAEGVVEGEVEVVVDMSESLGGGGSVSSGNRITMQVRGHANDDAALDGIDIDGEVAFGDSATARGGGETITSGAGMTATYGVGLTGFSEPGGPAVSRVSLEVTGTSGDADDAYVSQGSAMTGPMLMLIAINLLKAAERAWQSGRCVVLEPTVSDGPTGLAPDAEVAITAAPRSRIDGGPTGGTVTATLASGEASVAPSGRVQADADFTYTAPDERDEQGSVALEARSRRGVATATLGFDTRRRAWLLTGSIEGVGVEAEKCDGDTGTWHLDFEGATGGVTFGGTFTAEIGASLTGPVQGTFSYSGSGLSGSTAVSGSATVVTAADGSSGTFTITSLTADTAGQAGGVGFGSGGTFGPYAFALSPAPEDAC